MFGFFKKNKSWSSTREFLNDLMKVPGLELRNRAYFEDNFEEFTHVMDRSPEWTKFESSYLPDIHESRLSCYKYVTSINPGGVPKVLIEVLKQVASSGTLVYFIDLEKAINYASSIFEKSTHLRLNEDAVLDIPVVEAIDSLKIIYEYEEFFTMPKNTNSKYKIYKNYSHHILEEIVFLIETTKDGKKIFEGLFMLNGFRNTSHIKKISELPIGFDEYSRTYSRC